MKKSDLILFSLFLLTVLEVGISGSAYADNAAITGFGDGAPGNGWQPDDVRFNNTNIITDDTHAPAAGASNDPTAVENQIYWQNNFGTRGNLGGVHLDQNGPSSKSTISLLNSPTGFGSASALLNADFQAAFGYSVVSRSSPSSYSPPSLKIGIQSSLWGTGTGQSQEGFSAIRSGEGSWDIIIVGWNQNADLAGEFYTENYTYSGTGDNIWYVYAQASNGFYGSGPLGTFNSLQEIMESDIVLNGKGTLGDLVSGGTVSNMQFGVGSGGDAASSTLDWAAVNFLNDGDVIDFVDASTWVGATTGTQDFTLATNWSDDAGPSPTQNVVFTDAATFTAAVNSDTDARSIGVLNGDVTLSIANGATLTLNDDGYLFAENNATMNLTGDGAIEAAAIETWGDTNVSTTVTLTGGSEDNPNYGGRYAMIVAEDADLTLQSGADVTVAQDGVSPDIFVGGEEAGNFATLTLESGSSLELIGNGSGYAQLFVGRDSTGILNVNGGTLTLGLDGDLARLEVGMDGGYGTLNMSDGLITSAQYGTGQYVTYDVGWGTGSTGIVNQTGGIVDFNTAAALQIGVVGGSGTYNLHNDAQLILGGDGSTFYLGETTGGVGIMNLYDDAQFIQEVDTQSFIGEGGEGTINQIGSGTVVEFRGDTSGRAAWFGTTSGGAGTYNLEAGDLTFDTVSLRFGSADGATGVLDQSGGTLTATNTATTIGYNGDGEYNMSGGTANFGGNVAVATGASSTGSITQTGGTVSITNGGYLQFGSGTGSYTLNDGTLEIGGTNGIRTGGGTSTFTLGGGTIKVIESNLSTSMDFTLVNNDTYPAFTPSVIDTNGFNASFSGGIDGDGWLVKTGTGTLDLSSADRSFHALAVEQGEIEHSSGTTDLARLLVGAEPSVLGVADGTFTLTDGTINLKLTNGADVLVGSQDTGANTGILNIDGGVLNLGDATDGAIRSDMYVGGFGTTGSGTVNQTGGIVNKLSDDGIIHIGNQATGVYNLIAGTINVSGSNGMVLGRSGTWGTGNGTLNVSGGDLIFTEGTDLLLGGAQDTEPLTGSGTVNQTGGTVSIRDGGNLVIGQRGTGTYNLDGGVLEAGGSNRIRTGNGGAANFRFGGGTLRVIDSNLSVSSGINPELRTGTTSTIDTNGFNASFAGGFTGSGNLVKTGLGNLTLTGTSTNIGEFSIAQGMLAVNGSLGGTLVVNNGAGLMGSGVINAATTVSGLLAPGNSPGVLTFTNGLTLTEDSSVEIEFIANSTSGRGTNFDGVDVTGGLLTINPSATLYLSFNGTSSIVNFTDAFWDTNQSWLIFDNALTPDVDLLVFSDIQVSQDAFGNEFTAGIGSFAVSLQGDDVYLDFTAVPEPSVTALLLALGASIVVWQRRRARKTC
ncbi:MAG: hypothetical protein Q7Q73_16190 [Verrucomicrobiota bacterium JB024]|nr:hypothetical protein [Verrucomicrobiota bacterium JB024]